MHVGRTLRVTSDDVLAHEFTGRVTAVDSVVNEATRNIQVQATLANPGGKLRPGMFVQVEVVTGSRPSGDRTAGVRNQLRPVRRFGLRRHRSKDPKGKTYRGVRQQFVKSRALAAIRLRWSRASSPAKKL